MSIDRNMKRLYTILTVFLLSAFAGFSAYCSEATDSASQEKLNPKEIIFEHLGDAYG